MSCFKKKEIAVVKNLDTKVLVLGHDPEHSLHWLFVVWPHSRAITRIDPFDLVKLKDFEQNGGRVMPFPKPRRRIEGWD